MRNNKKGFTLVELLAVIVILGVLLLVAVPAVSRVMTNSKEKAAKDNALMVIRAFETCNMSEQTICDTTALANYMEGDTSNIDITVSGDNLTKFVISDFNGYSITISASGSTMTTADMKTAVQNGSFTSSAMNVSA